MDNGYMQEIRARILAAEDGAVFVAPDFADIADTATIRQGLKRLYQSGIIRRIIRGIYEKPKYSKLLDEYVAADPDAVAKALARCYHWTIAPCGNTALNLLGLSTQVTAVWSYISDGPYKTYEWNTLGRTNVTAEIIQTLSEKLSEAEKQACLKEATESTDWVYDTIRKMCGGDTQGGM